MEGVLELENQFSVIIVIIARQLLLEVLNLGADLGVGMIFT